MRRACFRLRYPLTLQKNAGVGMETLRKIQIYLDINKPDTQLSSRVAPDKRSCLPDTVIVNVRPGLRYDRPVKYPFSLVATSKLATCLIYKKSSTDN